MCAARTGFVLAGPLLDGTRSGVGERQAQRYVAGLQRAHRIVLQVSEGDIGKTVVTNTFAEVHRPTDSLGPAVELLCAQLLGIVTVAAPAAHVPNEAAYRTDDFGGITMAPQEFRVRIRLDEGIEGEHMNGSLEVPQRRWAMPLQEFEDPTMKHVGLPHVAFHQPRQVTRNPNGAVEVKGAETHRSEDRKST